MVRRVAGRFPYTQYTPPWLKSEHHNLTDPDLISETSMSDLLLPGARSANDALIRVQRRLLQVAAGNASIDESLNAVVLSAKELFGENSRAAIWLKSPLANTLRFGASIGLAEEYSAAIDNFEIGPDQPSCGRVMYIGHDVIVKDVFTDPSWAPYLALAERCGVRACWSFIIKDHKGKGLGTLAVYHHVPAEPDPQQYEFAEFLSNIASLLISRHLETQEKAQTRLVAERLLVSANENLRHTQAVVAHELRNPLQAISLGVASLEIIDDQSMQPNIRAIRRQLDLITALVDDMCDEQSVGAGHLRLNKSWIIVQDLVHYVVDSMRHSYNERGQSLTVHVPEEPILIVADASRLTQMVSNLLTNANKFTGENGYVSLTVSTTATEVLVKVKDNGVGLAEHDLESIFDMYTRATTDAGARQPGQGIGLSVVRELAKAHGGSVHASSAGLGLGCCFTISLPLPDTSKA